MDYLVYYCFDRIVYCFEYFVDFEQDCYNFDIGYYNSVDYLHYCNFDIVGYLSIRDNVGYNFVDYHNYIDY